MGGEQSGHTCLIQDRNGPIAATDAEIKLPANWNELLTEGQR